MSDPQAEGRKTPDPLEPFREMRDAYMDVWAKAMGGAVNSEAYSKASGAMLESFLTTSLVKPLRCVSVIEIAMDIAGSVRRSPEATCILDDRLRSLSEFSGHHLRAIEHGDLLRDDLNPVSRQMRDN